MLYNCNQIKDNKKLFENELNVHEMENLSSLDTQVRSTERKLSTIENERF